MIDLRKKHKEYLHSSKGQISSTLIIFPKLGS